MLVEAGASSGLKNISQMEKDAKCVQTFLANTAEEVSEIPHLRMGWEPYNQWKMLSAARMNVAASITPRVVENVRSVARLSEAS